MIQDHVCNAFDAFDGSEAALRALSQESITDRPVDIPAGLLVGLVADFGSVEAWRAAFVWEATRQPLSDGWIVLAFSWREGKLINRRLAAASDPSMGVQVAPLLACGLDVDTSDGVDRIEAFVERIDWVHAGRRFRAAVDRASEPFGVGASDLGAALRFDVRREGAFRAADELIGEATWLDPTLVDQWSLELPPGSEVVVYCVAGHEVSRKVTLRLRAAGIEARFLRGGIERWKASDLPTRFKARERDD